MHVFFVLTSATRATLRPSLPTGGLQYSKHPTGLYLTPNSLVLWKSLKINEESWNIVITSLYLGWMPDYSVEISTLSEKNEGARWNLQVYPTWKLTSRAYPRSGTSIQKNAGKQKHLTSPAKNYPSSSRNLFLRRDTQYGDSKGDRHCDGWDTNEPIMGYLVCI